MRTYTQYYVSPHCRLRFVVKLFTCLFHVSPCGRCHVPPLMTINIWYIDLSNWLYLHTIQTHGTFAIILHSIVTSSPDDLSIICDVVVYIAGARWHRSPPGGHQPSHQHGDHGRRASHQLQCAPRGSGARLSENYGNWQAAGRKAVYSSAVTTRVCQLWAYGKCSRSLLSMFTDPLTQLRRSGLELKDLFLS